MKPKKILFSFVLFIAVVAAITVFCSIVLPFWSQSQRFKNYLEDKYGSEFVFVEKYKTDIDDFYVKPETLGHSILVSGEDTDAFVYQKKDRKNYKIIVYYKEYYTYEVVPTRCEWYNEEFLSE